jgi:hypothetical protein
MLKLSKFGFIKIKVPAKLPVSNQDFSKEEMKLYDSGLFPVEKGIE